MNDTPKSPWEVPPQRQKKLAQRRAERLARRAAYWGERIEAARNIGPEAAASLTFDRARGELERLPDDKREAAFEALIRAVDTVRETHAQ
ncbi:hypothetical protein ACFRCI_38005 [Streptomyces sp. NPDC056638]|uniref:hypothetical protein n=1 Tax=unclassified Streptomyces TaxID=2593676 RepID=UPI0035E30427